ncbi:hypothetical protein K7432_005367 [Basidiobolus ranarum]|uniref:t-SNARE coiled-coil homology domain-containing protein n=1 Tax=Basidiobolus ranarum TaxID=34480 RepID=A0ABR2WWM7_9FUNG
MFSLTRHHFLIEYSKRLNILVTETSQMMMNVRSRIQAIEELSKNPSTAPSNLKAFRNRLLGLREKLKNALLEYQRIQHKYDEEHKETIIRQYEIVNPDATRDEIDAMVNDSDYQQVFAQAVLQSNRKEHAIRVLEAVQSRDKDIQKIHDSVLELAQLFQQIDLMIETQGAVIVDVENTTAQVVEHQAQSQQILEKTEGLLKKLRQKKLILLSIALIIIILIVVTVVVLTRPKSASS